MAQQTAPYSVPKPGCFRNRENTLKVMSERRLCVLRTAHHLPNATGTEEILAAIADLKKSLAPDLDKTPAPVLNDKTAE